MARQPLGRGIERPFGENPSRLRHETAASTNEIDIDLIEPNPQQPRTRFADPRS